MRLFHHESVYKYFRMTPQRFDHLLKNSVTKENAWTLKLVSWGENQGTYQTKEMIKPLRRHSKVFVETFIMKTISFPEGD